jgi:hypothetical protein
VEAGGEKLMIFILRLFLCMKFKLMQVDPCWVIYPYYGIIPHRSFIDYRGFFVVKKSKEE